MGHERDLELLRIINDSVSQLAMAVSNSIYKTAYDLNATAFSEGTAVSDDFIFDSIELNFSTTEAKTITITSADGTILWGGAVDQTAANRGYLSTAKNIYLEFNRGFTGGDNITVAVTQLSSPGTMDCVLKTRSGSNTLVGNPAVKWVDTNGTEHGFQTADGRPRISIVDYHDEISKGNIANHVHLWAKGERASVAIDARGEDIWRGPTPRIPHPAVAGEQMTIKSDDANDTAGGSGVRTLRIEYIDSNGLAQTEDKILNGGSVNTIATDIAFVNHIFATSVGSSGVAEGDIDIHKFGDDTTVYNLIALGGNMSLTCILRVPDNKTYFITEWHGGLTGNKPSDIRLRSTDWNNILYNGDSPVFLFKDVVPVGESTFDRHLTPPIRVPGGTTIKISVWATQAGGKAGGTINGYYE